MTAHALGACSQCSAMFNVVIEMIVKHEYAYYGSGRSPESCSYLQAVCQVFVGNKYRYIALECDE